MQLSRLEFLVAASTDERTAMSEDCDATAMAVYHVILQDLQCDFRFDLFLFLFLFLVFQLFFSFSYVLVFVIVFVLVLVSVNKLLFCRYTLFSFSFPLTKITLVHKLLVPFVGHILKYHAIIGSGRMLSTVRNRDSRTLPSQISRYVLICSDSNMN